MCPVGKGFVNQFLRKALKKIKKIKIKLKKNSQRRDGEKEESKNMGHQREESIRLAQSYSGFSLGAQQFCAFT